MHANLDGANLTTHEPRDFLVLQFLKAVEDQNFALIFGKLHQGALQQQSASERLQGVTFSSREDHLDPQVFGALLHTLRNDNSVDVRLAALDTLSRHANQPQIRKSVVAALQEQQSPMVQVALIDLLSEWRDPEAAQGLRNFQQIKNLNPTVRQRAEWAVSKLQ